MSVLDQMTRNASERKADASATLTPVGLEMTPPGAYVTMPADERRSLLAAFTEAIGHMERGLTVLRAAERNLNKGLGFTMEADYFDVDRGKESVDADLRQEADCVGLTPPEPPVDAVAVALEVFGEDAFAADYAAQQEAAKAATFKAAAQEGVLWVCPDHGFDHIITRKGRTRDFRACTACGQYEGKVQS
jgi:hypothetical protein